VDYLTSAWTGEALFSMNAGSSAGGPSFSVEPGDASAYDEATNTWIRIARAPFGCDDDFQTAWTGSEVLFYCPSAAAAAKRRVSGLAYVVTSADRR
jgi:hypothetical protein